MRLEPVPVYVRPRTVVATTLATAAGIAAIGWASAYAAWRVAHVVLQNHEKYGPRRLP